MKTFQISGICAVWLILVLMWGPTAGFAQQDGDDIVIGEYKVLRSDILNEDRLLFVHLPESYEDTELSYPVLYLLWVDIHNYFADAVMVTEKLGRTGEIPPVIIIGVANTNRYRDLLPVKSRDSGEGGGADTFISFLEKELIPHVDKTYRTKDFRILAGPQAGAIFSLYTLTTKPELFQAFISGNPFMNPSNTEFLYPRAVKFFHDQHELKNFLYIRCEKNEPPLSLEYTEKFAAHLEAEKPKNFRFKVEISEPSGYFIPPLPFREGLRTLFPGHKLPQDFKTETVGDIINYYKARSEQYGFEVDPPDMLLAFQGNKLSRQGKTDQAIQIFEYQLNLYPESLNALWQLAENYRRMGEFKKARDNYKRFLEIRSDDASMIQTRLDQMEKIISHSAAYRIEQEIKKNGIEAGLGTYQEIKSDPKNDFYFDENEFNALGYRLMGAGKMDGAIAVFRMNVKLFPKSANAYDSLGEAYMKNGDKELAIKNYEKSLELNPDNNNAREKLKELK